MAQPTAVFLFSHYEEQLSTLYETPWGQKASQPVLIVRLAFWRRALPLAEFPAGYVNWILNPEASCFSLQTEKKGRLFNGIMLQSLGHLARVDPCGDLWESGGMLKLMKEKVPTKEEVRNWSLSSQCLDWINMIQCEVWASRISKSSNYFSYETRF